MRSRHKKHGKTKGQSSLEFIIFVPVVFIIAIFIIGQFDGVTKSTIAMATAKTGFYEKSAALDKTVFVKKIGFLDCPNGLSLNFETDPESITTYESDITHPKNYIDETQIETQTENISGLQNVTIYINGKKDLDNFPADCP